MVNEQPTADHGQSVSSTTTSAKLQILSTEHWSLLASRSLTYGESFSRVGTFLTVLTGAVVALALLAQVGHFDRAFTLAALLILSVVFFLGLATLGRLGSLGSEDLRWVMGMNRLRRGYLEMYPDLEPYFVTGSHDDFRGVAISSGYGRLPGQGGFGEALHGFTTLPAVVGVIVSVVAGVLGALVANAFGAPEEIAIGAGAAAFFATIVAFGFFASRAFNARVKAIPSRYPSTTQEVG